MREIKFRAWNESLKMMFICPNETHSLMIADSNTIVALWCSDGIFDEIPIDSLMQFTGLQDKNGVDIYEGDIDEKGFVFTYVVDMGGWYRMKNGEGLQWHSQALRNGRLPLEVSGNIHQNPELV